ncbi:MAG TPA: glycosyltransferase 87 family protein [Blastocatellia bacterium]|nr:glycosyltransferase 87 family protein [Blastocatellia bacterium]
MQSEESAPDESAGGLMMEELTEGGAVQSQRRLHNARTALSVAVVPVALIVLGVASTSLYFWGRDLHRFTQWLAAYISLFVGQLGLYLLACYTVQRWSDRSSAAARWAAVALVIFFAAASRAVLVPQRPYLSSDVYRFVWDGRVQSAGINPYRYAPEAAELSGLRDERIYPNINREDKQWRSPYPPVAQVVFLAIARMWPMSVTAFKAAMSAFDLLTIILLMLVLARSGIDPARAIIFAWHPLVIFEGAHSGHIEALYIAFLALALLAWSSRKHAFTGISLALATLVKFYPALLLPVFLGAEPGLAPARSTRRSEKPTRSILCEFTVRVIHKRNLAMMVAFGATIVLAYAAYWGAGGNSFWFLREYVEQEGFVQSGARYFLLDAVRKVVWIPTDVFLVFAAASLMAVAVWQLLRARRDASEVARGALVLIGTYLLLTTPRYAWYYAWLVPFLCFAPRLGWLYLSCASVLLYLVWYTPLVYPEVPLWLGASLYVPTLAWLGWDHFSRGRQSEVRTATSRPA